MSQPLTPEFMLALYLPDGTDISRYKQIDARVTLDDSLSPYIGRVEIVIEEQNIVPPDIPPGTRVESKGFYEPVSIYDFPLRNKLAELVVRRRRWIDKDTGESLHVPFAPKHSEAFSSRELIDFLK
jgi:hypothetical protein